MSESTDPNLKAIESALRALTPAAAAIPRDRLLYEAGRRSSKRGHWPILTGLFATSTLLLGLHVATQPEPTVQVVDRPTTKAASSEMVVSEPRVNPEEMSVLSPSPWDKRFAELLRPLDSDFGPAPPLPPPVDWLGLPPNAFRKPLKPHPGFGPIQRGDV